MSNQWWIPPQNDGTVQSYLTLNPIDLSSGVYNKKTFTRKHIFDFISDILESEDSTFSYVFDVRGDRVGILLTKQDKTTEFIRFNFPPRASYEQGGWKKFTFREFLSSMLRQQVTVSTIDYKSSKQFRFYFI